jgi:hypothetical protein
VAVTLVTIEGAGHVSTPRQVREAMTPAVVAWFETHPAKRTVVPVVRGPQA